MSSIDGLAAVKVERLHAVVDAARVAEIAAADWSQTNGSRTPTAFARAVYRDLDGNELDFGGTPVEAG